jgi:glycosyltransferase involved in cell wall biosynthesis
MRIIQLITKKQRRGAEIFAAQLSEQLQGFGHELLLIALYDGEAVLPFSGKTISLGRNHSRRMVDRQGWKILSTIIADFQPDLIQANASDTLKFASFSKLFYKWSTPLIYRNANQMSLFIRGKAAMLFNKLLMQQVTGVASVSQASMDDFKRLFPVPLIERLPIGIDPESIAQKCEMIRDKQIGGEYLLFTGSLVQEKNPMGMLAIFNSVVEKHPSLQLIFLGSGPLAGSLKEKIKALGMESRVRLIPNQENIFPILSQAKAVVMPSKIEGLPAVILEAMYCKVPVIAYDVGGISEVLTDQTGWLIPAGDQKAFAEAIDQVLQLTDTDKNQITERAFQLVSTDYTIEKIARQFEGFYSGVIAPVRRGGRIVC